MQSLISDKLWERIAAIAKKSHPRLAAIGYVSIDRFVKFGKGDTLIVDASTSTVAGGLTDAKVLAAAHKRGTEVLHVPGLHAKLLVLGDVAVIGSANLSDSSANDLIEAAFVTDNKSTASAAKAAIYQLAEQAEEVDDAFLERILAIKVKRKGGRGGKRPPKMRVSTNGGAAWVVGVQEVDADLYPDEDEVAERGEEVAKRRRTWRNSSISWIRWTGSDFFVSGSKEGDSVIQVLKGLDGKTRVHRHASILLKQKERRSLTRFYVEEAPRSGRVHLTLRQFRTLLKKCGYSARIGPQPLRQLDQHISDDLFRKWKK